MSDLRQHVHWDSFERYYWFLQNQWLYKYNLGYYSKFLTINIKTLNSINRIIFFCVYWFSRFGLLKVSKKKLQVNKEKSVVCLLSNNKLVFFVAEIMCFSKFIVKIIKNRCCTSLNVSKGGSLKLLSKTDESFCVH